MPLVPLELDPAVCGKNTQGNQREASENGTLSQPEQPGGEDAQHTDAQENCHDDESKLPCGLRPGLKTVLEA